MNNWSHTIGNFHQTLFEDCTQLLFDACEDLQVDDLLAPENFSLAEAMSVIEIMDPKMDSGLNFWVENGHQEKNSNAIEAYDLYAPITTSQLVGVMDQLFCCEMTWFSGYTLGQTIYTCHYALKANKLPSLDDRNIINQKINEFRLSVLKTYVIGCIKSSQLIWSEMVKGNGYEEEDFSSNKIGLSFFPEITIQDAINNLKLAEISIREFIEKSKDNLDNIELELWEHCRLRLKSRKYFLKSIHYLSLLYCEQYSQANKSLIKLLDLYEQNKITNSINSEILSKAFNNRLICLLNSSAPPRKVTMIQYDHAIKGFIEVIRELIFITKIKSFKSILHLENMLKQFADKLPDCSPISRSLLSTAIFYDRHFLGRFGILSVGKEVIKYYSSNLYQLILYIQNQTSIEYKKITQHFTEFNYNFSQFWVVYFQTMAKNKPRQRRILSKFIDKSNSIEINLNQLKDNILHILLDIKDINIKSIINQFLIGIKEIQNLILIQRYDIMVQIIIMGFQQELYSQHEYLFIYFQFEHILTKQALNYYSLLNIEKWDEIPIKLQSLISTNELVQDQSISKESNYFLKLINNQIQLYFVQIIINILSTLIHNCKLPDPTNENTQFNQPQELKYNYRFKIFWNSKNPIPLTYSYAIQKHWKLQNSLSLQNNNNSLNKMQLKLNKIHSLITLLNNLFLYTDDLSLNMYLNKEEIELFKNTIDTFSSFFNMFQKESKVELVQSNSPNIAWLLNFVVNTN